MKLMHIKIAVVCFLFNSIDSRAAQSLPEPAIWSFPEVVDLARKISPNNVEGKPFNKFGLVYSSEEVEKLKLSALPATELEKYADIVTHAYPDAVSKQLPSSCANIEVENLNQTAVAGIAYISINAIESRTRNWAKDCLSLIQLKLKKIGK